MNNIDEITEHIKLIDRVIQAKKELPSLSINWETDLAKMDFTKLENGKPFCDISNLRVDYISDNPVGIEELFEDRHSALRMLDYIEIVKSEEKIIPPITRIDYEFVDGQIDNKLSFLCNKGRRMLLARFLNYHSIPTIIWERISDYTFSPNKYQFDVIDDFLIATSKSDGAKYHIDIKRFNINRESVNHLKLSAFR